MTAAGRILLACGAIAVSAGALANHNWGGIDVCAVYRNTAPPGLDAAALPQPQSAGAQLVTRYCTQCHALPGPGHHTAEEWPAVLDRMQVLMDTSQRFRGLMGRIAAPDASEHATLRAYLAGNALAPLHGTPRGPGAGTFATRCATCHALPDPRQHAAGDWPAVVARMARNAAIMQRDQMASETQDQIVAYLQAAAGDRLTGDARGAGMRLPQAPAAAEKSDYGIARLAMLTPFFVMSGIGAARWWRGTRRQRPRHHKD